MEVVDEKLLLGPFDDVLELPLDDSERELELLAELMDDTRLLDVDSVDELTLLKDEPLDETPELLEVDGLDELERLLSLDDGLEDGIDDGLEDALEDELLDELELLLELELELELELKMRGSIGSESNPKLGGMETARVWHWYRRRFPFPCTAISQRM